MTACGFRGKSTGEQGASWGGTGWTRDPRWVAPPHDEAGGAHTTNGALMFSATANRRRGTSA
jgi:hypothetical protein